MKNERIASDNKSLRWISDDSFELQSHKFPKKVANRLNKIADRHETMTQSRLVGSSIEFNLSLGRYLDKLEERLDKELLENGLYLSPSPRVFYDISKEKNYWDYCFENEELLINAENMGRREFRVYQTTIPRTYMELFDEYVEPLEHWNHKNKYILLSNMILEFLNSPFSSKENRIWTKEQILETTKGVRIPEDEKTKAFRLIEQREIYPKVGEKISSDPRIIELESGEVVNVPELEIESDVEISPKVFFDDDYSCYKDENNHPLKQTRKERVPFALAVIRWRVNKAVSAYSEHLEIYGLPTIEAVLGIIKSYNPDYTDPTYLFENYIRPELVIREYDGEDYVFLNESQVPSEMIYSTEDIKFGLIKEMKRLDRMVQNSRNLKAALNSNGYNASEFLLHGGSPNELAMEKLSQEELSRICQYLAEGIETKNKSNYDPVKTVRSRLQ